MILKNSLVLTTLLVLQFCHSQSQSIVFDLEGSSFFSVMNETSHPIRIELENWYLLPWKSQKEDTIIQGGGSVSFQLISQGNTYFNLKIDSKNIKIFAKPNSTDRLTIREGLNETIFSGDLKSINEFLEAKSMHFNSIDADWIPRVNSTHGNDTFLELIKVNDSITKIHLDYLNTHKQALPESYITFESKRLKYLNAHWKLNSRMYRIRMLNKTDSVPNNFLEKTIGTLPVQDESMLGNIRYMNFLMDYIGHNSDPNFEGEKPNSRDEWVDFYDGQIEVIQSKLNSKVKDVYLAFVLGNIIEQKRYVFEDEWLKLIEDERLVSYLKEYLESKPILPEGSETPYFHLPDIGNGYYEPSKLIGKIVVINFWATWCKPCIKEFPYENKLVDKFRNEPVEIVNICINSMEDRWKTFIDQYDLKATNLLADKKWNDKLTKDFGISALPHSVLIDWTGKVVQNKCPRASEDLDKLILQLLIDKKNEDNNR